MQSAIPCQFECFPPAVPNGNSCSSPAVCDTASSGMIAHKSSGQTLLSMGNCVFSEGQVAWGKQVVTMEAHCGDNFRPFRFNLDFLGRGDDNRGQWTIRDCESGNHLTVVDKTLQFADH